MTQITILINRNIEDFEKDALKDALETIANKANLTNVQFLAEIALKPGINEKLEKKKGIIRRNL